MAQNICNICGANYEYKNGKWICPACGAYKPEELSNEEVTLLYNASQKIRLALFDDAEEQYKDIVAKYPDNPDGYWGLVLAKYGIKYEQDYDGKMIPSCYAASYESVLTDKNYLKAIELADKDNKKYYEEQANKIEKIRKEWIEKASKEDPYDIFISYKDTESEDGRKRTQDSYDALELYTMLSKLGYRVFYSRESLKDKTGEKYEPYIFNALNTAHIMIVYGSKPEYIESTWIKNEWMRFYKRIKLGKKQPNALLVINNGFNPAELPSPLSKMQTLDRNRLDFSRELESYCKRVIKAATTVLPKIERVEVKAKQGKVGKIVKIEAVELNSKTAQKIEIAREEVEKREIGSYTVSKLTANAENELKIAEMQLSTANFDEAGKRFNAFLLKNPKNGRALTGKFLAENKSKDLNEFSSSGVQNFADWKLLEQVLLFSEKSVSEKILKSLCDEILRSFNTGDFVRAKDIYSQVSAYEDSAVTEMRKSVCDLAKGLIGKNDDTAKYFIDGYLLYEQDEDKFLSQIRNIVGISIEKGDFNFAKKYSEDWLKYENYDLSANYSALKIKYKVKTLTELFAKIENNNVYSEIDDILHCLNEESAADCFKDICDRINTLLSAGNSAKQVYSYIDKFFRYIFDGRAEKINQFLIFIANKPSKEFASVFDLLLSLSDFNTEEYSVYTLRFANTALKNGDFDLAEKYYDKVNELHETTLSWEGKLKCRLKVKSITEYPANIHNLTDFKIIESILSLSENDDKRYEFLSRIIGYVYSALKYPKTDTVKLVAVFENLLAYVPKDYDDKIIEWLFKFARTLKGKDEFDLAEKMYAIIVNYDAENHIAYWEMLQAKLHCKDENSVIKQYNLISDFQEFQNALLASANNDSALRHYIDIQNKQKAWIEQDKLNKIKAKKRKKIFKVACIIFAVVVIAVAGVFGGLTYYNSENILKYNSIDGGLSVYAGKFYKAEETLVIPQAVDGKTVTEIGANAFENHTEIKKVIIPTTVKTIGESAFSGCVNLESVEFNNISEASANTQANANENNGISLFSAQTFNAVSFAMANTTENIELAVIGARAFKGCAKLKAFDLNYGLKTIGEEAFSGSGLKEIAIPETVEFVGKNVFENCNSLTVIEVGDRDEIPQNWDTDWNKGQEVKVEFSVRVVFDYNGADRTIKAEQYVVYEKSYNFPVPTKEGYTFDGWYRGETKLTGKDGVSLSDWNYTDGGTVKAEFTANENTLFFNGNGATGGNMSSQKIHTAEKVNLNTNGFTRAGYTFKGWSTIANGMKSYNDGALYTMGKNSSYVLYAVWQANTNVLHFNANGGSGTMPDRYIQTDETKALFANEFARNGYDFVGWATEPNGAKTYNDKASYTMGTDSEYTLYALWSIKTFSITYNLNYGSVDSANPAEFTVETDTFTLNNPKRDGYTFTGWSGTEISGTAITVTIAKGSIGDREYTANWEANINALHFNPNGGEGTMADMQIATDSTATLSANTFTRSGYTFVGWSTTADGTKVYNDNASYKMGTNSEYTLYAIWETITYTIQSNNNYTIQSNNNRIINSGSSSDTTWIYSANNGGAFAPASANGAVLNLVVHPNVADGSVSYRPFYVSFAPDSSTSSGFVWGASTTYGLNSGRFMIEFMVNDDINGIYMQYHIPNGAGGSYSTGYMQLSPNIWNAGATVSQMPYFTLNIVMAQFSGVWDVVINDRTDLSLVTRISANGWGANGFSAFIGPDYFLAGRYNFAVRNKSDLSAAINAIDVYYGGCRAIDSAGNTYIWENESNISKIINYTVESETFILDNPTRIGYTFTGWSGTEISGTAITVTIAKGSIGDRVYIANWEANINALHFNPNGGEGTMADMLIATDNTTTLSPNTFTRKGYTFVGWSTTADGTKVYNDNASYTMGTNSEYTLYAVWSLDTYSISYNLNGGTANGNPSNYNVNTATFTVNNPTRKGYNFIGWSGTDITNYSLVVTVAQGSVGNRSYTANWTPNLNTLHFNANGGSGEMADMKISTDSTATLSANTFTRKGYSFTGWATSANGLKLYNDKASYTMGTDTDYTLYAIWSRDTYNITYNLNGGTLLNANPTTYNVDTATFTLNNPTRTGYNFIGWSGTDVTDNSLVVTITQGSVGNRSFTANWEVINYNISYDLAGGTVSSVNPTSYNIATNTFTLNNPTRAGYIFNGWSGTSLSGARSSVSISKGSTGDRTYTANWSIITYTITYRLRDGSADGNPTSYTVTTNTFTLNNPTKAGYTFAGWSGTDVTDNSLVVTITQGSIGDRSYTANWEEMNYNISYDLAGGTVSSVNPTSYNIATNTFTLNNPTRAGYTFAGWSGTGISGTSSSVSISKGSIGNRSYTSNWQIIEYSVSYSLAGSSVSGNVTKYTVEDTFALNNPTRAGYTFAGWSGTDISGKSMSVSVPKGSIGNRSYAANWQANLNVIILTDGTSSVQATGHTDEYARLPANTFVKENHEFKGWATTQGGEVAYYDRDLYPVGPNSSYTLYAVWEEKEVVDRTGWTPISTVAELNNIRNNLSGKYYLTCDLDMDGYEWTPIGRNLSPFTGVFDGNDHTIYNLSSNANFVNSKTTSYKETFYYYGFGLFGYNKGTIKNATLYGADIKHNLSLNSSSGDINIIRSYYEYGGIVCAYNAGHINNCYAQGNIYFNSNLSPSSGNTYGYNYFREAYLGGICGTSNNVTNCVADVSIISNVNSTMGYVVPNTDNIRSLTTNVLNPWDEWYIKYACQNGKYRYQFGKWHSIVNALEPFETKAGYTFIGWALSNGGAVKYRAGDECFIPLDKTSLTLYPVWQANTNDVIFNANGGSGEMTNQQIQTDATAKLSANVFTKTGYHFIGWATSSDGQVEFTDKADYTMGVNSSYTLYAVWEQNTNEIIFNATKGSGSMANQEGLTNSTVTLNQCTFTAPTGYYFAGWSEDPNGSADYLDCASFSVGTNSVYNLYAVWAPFKFTITLDAQGGEIANDSMIVDYGSIPNLEIPSFEHYEFGGWFTAIGGSGAKCTDENGLFRFSYEYLSDIMVYAYWKCKTELEFSVTNNGVCSITGITDKTIEELYLPEYYNGYQITVIAEEAFKDCSALKVVYIPDCYLQIGEGAFKGCSSIETITLPFIGQSRTATYYQATFGWIFGYNKTENINASVTSSSSSTYGTEFNPNAISAAASNADGGVLQYAYYRRTGYQAGDKNLWWLSSCALYYYIPNGIKTVIITDATVLKSGAFYNCDMIEKVYINNTEIETEAYYKTNCSATFYYYSSILPTQSGNYWHYDSNGDIIIW